MFNKKRKDYTYLKMKNGKVIDTPNPYPTEEDILIDEKDKEFQEFNNTVNKTENSKENKKSKLLLIVGLLFIIIPFLIIGFNIGKKYIYQLQEYMILGENTESNIDDNTEIINPINKINVNDVLEITNVVNASFKTSYNGLKEDVILYKDNKESLFATKNKLETRKIIVEKNKEYVVNKKALLVKNKQEELYNIFIERFDLLLETINILENDISRKTAIEITNNGINSDNLLLNEETSLIRKLLDDTNTKYKETEDGIIIE